MRNITHISLIAICQIIFCSLQLSAQTCCSYKWDTQNISPTSNSNGVALEDVDNDGDIDAVLIQATTPIEVQLNNSLGQFSLGSTFGTATAKSGIKLADFNGDGFLDVVVTTINANLPTEVYLNNGSGIFITNGQTLTLMSAENVATGDLDADGDIDFFHASTSNQIFFNNGSGIFTNSGQNLTIPSNPKEVRLADFDADGDLDAAIISSGFLYIWLNNGSGVFTNSGLALNTGSFVEGLAVGDINSDGHIDIITAGVSQANTWLNNGVVPLLFTQGTIPVSAVWQNSIQLADADGDSDLDVFIGNSQGWVSLEILNNDGLGNFSMCFNEGTGPTLGTISYSNEIGVADLNGNGFPDVYHANTQTTVGDFIAFKSFTIPATINLNTCNGNPVFFNNIPYTITGTYNDTIINTSGCDTSYTITVFNQIVDATISQYPAFCVTDAATNLVAATNGGVWSGTGIVNTANGTFDPSIAGVGTHQIIYTISGICSDTDTINIIVNSCIPLPPSGCCNFVQNTNNNGLTSETFGVKLGDLDGDGDLDAVTIDAYDAIEVWFNNGSGIFATGTTYSIGSDFYGVELEDIDNDGDLDIIAISFYVAQATEIWKNNGVGIFSLYQSISNNIGSENSRLSDLDGDGDLDIFHTNWMGNEQKIYLNNGVGNFSYFNSVNTTGAKSDVALADFDGDGDIDAILSDKNGANNELWLNNGSGTFTLSLSGFALNSNHSGTAAADFDGDGDIDFVIIGGASNAPAELYLNNGNATFGSAIVLAHLGSNFDKDVVTIDYDSDGDIDIIISTYGSNGVEVWNNDGAANFSLCYKNPSSVYAHDFDVGDVDGDGLVDLYLGNFSSNDGDRVFIQVPPVTTIANASDTIICSGDTVTLTGSGSSVIGYTWNNGVINGVAFNPTVTTTYTVTGTNGNGCNATDTITIFVNNCIPLIASFSITTDTICTGDSVTFSDNSIGTGIISWNWTFNGGNPSNSSTQGPHTIAFATAGIYNITLQINDGSTTDDTTIIIAVNPPPQLTLIKTDDNCSENIGSVTANVVSTNPPVIYSWSTGSTDSIISNLPAGTYNVTVNDLSGCTNVGFINVTDLEIDCDFFVYVPNMFSPNGDGNNDVFFIHGKGIVGLSVKIYNRWGNKVFEMNDVNQGWDGKFNGADQNTGVFVFILEANFLNGKKVTKSGDISLIR